VSPRLPIWQIHEAILGALRQSNRLVLAAPTGSGKTTQVPQMVLEAGLAGGKKIVVLQPRRVAARAVAARVAWERGGKLGSEVGYQVRFDDTTSPGTLIAFVTEGILLRWLQDDPKLGSIGALVFDEFHERNLLSDVSLALAKRLQETSRPDLKILVMSATLEVEPLARYLAFPPALPEISPIPCPVLVSEGRMFPVQIVYAGYQDETPAVERAAAAVERVILDGEAGDILVFMPGMGEINATIRGIQSLRLPEPVTLIPLHGDLPPEDQDRAFLAANCRKIIVSTNVAETSVTIDGIRHVVDSGLARISRYDPERGFSALQIEEISRASADQRAGRAGRTAPGTCHRLWTESGHLNRPARNTPEIQRADLAEAVLLLHSLGIRQAAEFDWLDKPDRTSVQRAETLLRSLGALRQTEDEAGESRDSDITPLGRQMLRLPMHPRYARMLIEAARGNCLPAAALCAALVSGRDLLTRLGRDDAHVKEARELFEGSPVSDFHTLMRAFQFARNGGFNVERCRRYGIHAATARQIDQTFEQILEMARRQGLVKENSTGAEPPSGPGADEALCRAILAGFLDQVCVRRNLGSLDCEMTEGRQGKLMRESVVQNAPLLAVALVKEVTLRDSGRTTLLGLATAIKREWLVELAPDQIRHTLEHVYDHAHKRVAAIRFERFHDLVIHHQHQAELDPEASGACLADAYLRGEFELPLFNHELRQLIARANFAARFLPELELPPFTKPNLKKALATAFRGVSLAKQAQAVPLREPFERFLGRDHLGLLDELAPTRLKWPEGKPTKLVYSGDEDETEKPSPPEAQVKLADCFTLKEHPLVCEGRVPARLLLQTPDGKRLETTTDWPAFRASQYPKLRGVLAKKFPGQIWP
jgi:ATP-dependent helicase HrpB